MIKVLKILYALLNMAIIIALLSIHFVFKEESYQSSLLFYAFPLPIIILIGLFLTLFLSKKIRKYNLIVLAIVMIIWLGRSFKIHFPENIVASDLEIVFWNGARGNDLKMAFEENDGIPDVLVLSEINDEDIIGLRDEYPGLYFYKNQRELMVFSQTPLSIKLDTVSRFSTSVLCFETAHTKFYAVDVMGSTDVPRTWELGFVNSIIKKQTNTIILGDFNVPFESQNLENIKKDFNHAFNEKGNGFRETWFWNIPLLSLDHIWVSKDLEVLKTEKIGTFKSDHSMVKTFIRK